MTPQELKEIEYPITEHSVEELQSRYTVVVPTEEICYYHGKMLARNSSGTGDKLLQYRYTVCYFYDEVNNSLNLGFAFCSPSDQFVKRVGRKIAHDRLFGQPFALNLKRKPSTKQVIEAVATVIGLAADVGLDLPHFPHKLEDSNYYVYVSGN